MNIRLVETLLHVSAFFGHLHEGADSTLAMIRAVRLITVYIATTELLLHTIIYKHG
jgi:hypothetical protein